jgi:hypothetical protein
VEDAMTGFGQGRTAEDVRRSQFERAVGVAADRAWASGIEEELLAALFDVLDGAAQRADADPR